MKKAETAPELLGALLTGLAREFSRVALFHIDGTRLVAAERLGFADTDTSRPIRLPADSILTRAVATGRLESVIPSLRGEPNASLPFGGTPACALAIPIVARRRDRRGDLRRRLRSCRVRHGGAAGAGQVCRAAAAARAARAAPDLGRAEEHGRPPRVRRRPRGGARIHLHRGSRGGAEPAGMPAPSEGCAARTRGAGTRSGRAAMRTRPGSSTSSSQRRWPRRRNPRSDATSRR